MWSWVKSLQNSLEVYSVPDGKIRVCLVKNTPIGEEVIVKQVICDSEVEAARVLNEGLIAKRNVHPNILECFEAVRETGPDGRLYVFLIMPRMPVDLEQETERRSKSNQVWPEPKLWEFAKDLISTFAFLQRNNIAHRDIKPANILLDQNTKVKICDFGFAKDIDLKGLQVQTVLGTVPYFSPLLRTAYIGEGEPTHVQHDVFKSDVYSLGVTLLHLMLLEYPKKLTDLRSLQQTIDDLLKRATGYTPRFRELIRRMLNVEEGPRPDFLQLDAEFNHPQPFADDEMIPQQAQVVQEILQDGLEFTAKCGLSQVRVCATRHEEVPCMLHIKAPSTDPDTLERLRTGVDFVCVIDVSGSMAGSQIRRVIETLNKLVQLLKEIDRVSIATFNDQASRVCPLIACHSLGKERLFQHIASLKASGGTNLIGGCQLGVDIVLQRRYRNQSASILLFSDGQDGTKRDAKAECMAAIQKVSPDNSVTVHTLGYGGDIDADLMTALASEGRGMLHAVKSEQDMRDAFAMTLGSTTSVIAREIEIRLRVNNQGAVPCEISKIYAKELNSDYYYLPEITANQSKDFIFLLKPAAMALNGKKNFTAVFADIKYIDGEGTEATRSIDFPIKFTPWEGAPPPVKDLSVHINWNRVLGADYLRDAKNLADQRRFQDAARKLSNALELLGASGYADHPIVAAVISDIEAAQKLVNSDTTWDRGGAAHFASVSYSHYSQSAATGSLQYASPQQQSYRSQFSTLSSIPEAEEAKRAKK